MAEMADSDSSDAGLDVGNAVLHHRMGGLVAAAEVADWHLDIAVCNVMPKSYEAAQWLMGARDCIRAIMGNPCGVKQDSPSAEAATAVDLIGFAEALYKNSAVKQARNSVHDVLIMSCCRGNVNPHDQQRLTGIINRSFGRNMADIKAGENVLARLRHSHRCLFGQRPDRLNRRRRPPKPRGRTPQAQQGHQQQQGQQATRAASSARRSTSRASTATRAASSEHVGGQQATRAARRRRHRRSRSRRQQGGAAAASAADFNTADSAHDGSPISIFRCSACFYEDLMGWSDVQGNFFCTRCWQWFLEPRRVPVPQDLDPDLVRLSRILSDVLHLNVMPRSGQTFSN